VPETSATPRSVAEVDWEHWQPDDHATLVFIVRRGQVLLIHKKRGLGAGKINGPGGKLDAGESALDCAIREVREEVGLLATGLRRHGELRFQFTDGYAIWVEVFRAAGANGSLCETDEARPFWTPIEAIPYERMWADDRVWLPILLRGGTFSGRFVFEGDSMLDHQLRSGRAPDVPSLS
jgi:8-oxo-dGTP diphosphatase